MGFNSAFKGLKLLKPQERTFKQFKWLRPQCVNTLVDRLCRWPAGIVCTKHDRDRWLSLSRETRNKNVDFCWWAPYLSADNTLNYTRSIAQHSSPFHRFLCAVIINLAPNWLYSSLRTARQSRLAYVIAMHYLYAVRVTVPQGLPWYCLLQWEFGYLSRYSRSLYTRNMSGKLWFDYRRWQQIYLLLKTYNPALGRNQPHVHFWQGLKWTGCESDPFPSVENVLTSTALCVFMAGKMR